MSRLSAVASVALAVPVVLLVAGLNEQAPAHAEAAAVPPINVVRVTKAVRPVTVKRVIERAPDGCQGDACESSAPPASGSTA